MFSEDNRLEGRKLALQVAEHIELYPETYNQETWGSVDCLAPTIRSCNTPACVAGWAVRLANEEAFAKARSEYAYIQTVAATLLGFEVGVDNSSYSRLFDGGNDSKAMPEVLREYAITGKVPDNIPQIPED